MTDVAEKLTTSEADLLAMCEETIERGLKTFVEVGKALMQVRDARLYREHGTFEDYCAERFAISRPRAYELMTAAEVVSGIPDTMPQPANAQQALELAKVPEADRADVWAKTVEQTNGNPTAAAVRAVANPQTTDAPSVGVGTLSPPAAPSEDSPPFRGVDEAGVDEAGGEDDLPPLAPEPPASDPIAILLLAGASL